ncbi:MAG: 2OG-Fe(II) oxygenase [Bdellovibrionales bacterium]|nr:2OG-Fe(II) oxygenase [Bdellovibrionales bacterium]
MENKNDLSSLSEALATCGLWVSDDFISMQLTEELLRISVEKKEMNQFRPAKIGKGVARKKIKEIRGDEIHWIEDWSLPSLLIIQEKLTEVMGTIRKELFIPLKRFESQFAHYPPNSRYLRHQDRHKVQPHRWISAVIYLGLWNEGDGGALIVKNSIGEDRTVYPTQGRIAVFLSELEHEVKKTNVDRWSLTTWFRDDVL